MTAARRITLRAKLLASFVGVGLWVAVLLLLGEYFISDAVNRLEAALKVQVRPLAQLNRLQSQIGRIRVLEVELPRQSDLFAVSDQVELLKAEAASFDRDLNAYLTSSVAFDVGEMQRLNESWNRYRADLSRVERAALAMHLSEVHRIATFDSAQRFKSVSRLLKQGAETTEVEATRAYAEAVKAQERQRLGFLGASLAGLALLALWFGVLARSVTQRLSHLTHAAERLAAGHQQRLIALTGNDELADLSQAFNTMQSKVGSREAALRDAQEALEARVAERTEALRQANATLLVEVDERRKAQQMLQYQAHFDGLTGLPNRTLAMDRLEHALRAAQRQQCLLALVFVDLDDFKKVNDSLGHAAGDELLVQAADRLRAAVRADDTVARFGGDEFVMILSGLKSADDATVVVELVLRAFEPAFALHQEWVTVTPSMGLAVYPVDGLDSSVLLRNADLALYDAKDAGRNTYRYFNQSVQQRSQRRIEIEADLGRAVAQQELWLAYQPLVATQDQRILGFEALLRWARPHGDKVPVSEFIAVAEGSGLIIAIGNWVLAQACAQIAQWRAATQTDLYVAVNVSPRQFHDPQLLDTVRSLLQRHGLPGACLHIEVTEGLLLRNAHDVKSTMQALRAMGVGIAMDDFGTGYSSLSYVKRFPFDTIKIDREFVCNLQADADDRALVSAAIRMGKSLGLLVVSEGVETAEQFDFLQRQECDVVQGFLFGAPATAAQVEDRWLRQPTAGHFYARAP
ncbi:MAG: putative bifunctional diguanylate cyclase/phosphodiesterase [Rhodoferax sp.]